MQVAADCNTKWDFPPRWAQFLTTEYGDLRSSDSTSLRAHAMGRNVGRDPRCATGPPQQSLFRADKPLVRRLQHIENGKLRQREEGTQAFWGINSISAFPLLVRTHEDIAVPARSSACLLASSALTLRLSPGTSTLIATLLVGGRHAGWTVLLRLRCRKPVVRRRWLRAVVSGARLRDPRPSLHQKAARAVRGEPQVWARPQLRVVVAKALQQGAGLISNSKTKPTTQVNKK